MSRGGLSRKPLRRFPGARAQLAATARAALPWPTIGRVRENLRARYASLMCGSGDDFSAEERSRRRYRATAHCAADRPQGRRGQQFAAGKREFAMISRLADGLSLAVTRSKVIGKT